MTHEELAESVEKAERWFSAIPYASPELVEMLITEGFLSYTDVTFLEPAHLAEMAGVTEEQADEMVLFAEEEAERIEREGEPEFEKPAPAEEVPAADGEAVPASEGEQVAAEGEPAAVPEGEPALSMVIDDHVPPTTGDFHSLFAPDDRGTEQPQPDEDASEAAADEPHHAARAHRADATETTEAQPSP
jgi:N utilization substance protein A